MDDLPFLSQRAIAIAYATDPMQSQSRVFGKIRTHFPAAAEERLRAVLGGR